jgi:hypothetical protein
MMMQNIKMLVWDKKSQLEIWFSHLQVNSLDFIRFASFFGVGFLGGLFFKRWSKYIILITMSLTIFLAILQGFSIITINFVTIARLTGLQSITNIQTMIMALIQIAQKYTWELSCSGIGFIIGFKTG